MLGLQGSGREHQAGLKLLDYSLGSEECRPWGLRGQGVPREPCP